MARCRLALALHGCAGASHRRRAAIISSAAMRERELVTAGLGREPSIIVAPLVWAAHFLLCYSLLSIGCAQGWQATSVLGLDLIRVLLLLLTAAAVIALLALLTSTWRSRHRSKYGSRQRFSATTAAGLAFLSLIAVVWIGLAIIFMPPCQ